MATPFQFGRAATLPLGIFVAGYLGSALTWADTPRILDDPEAFRKAHPTLAAERLWTEFATPEQQALFDGPEVQWPVVPAAEYDLSGFSTAHLYSKVPPPGVHPRILFSPEDVPAIRKQLESTKAGQKRLIETDYFLAHSIYDPSTDEGKIFAKLVSGDLTGLDWPDGEGDTGNANYFKGYKPLGVLSPHFGYFPRVLQAAAFRCLLDDDKVRGVKVATAMANYWKLREPLIDKLNNNKDLPNDFWRPMHQLCTATQLGFGYDLAAKWMTPEQQALMRRVISKATSGKLAYGENGPTRWRETNWTGWDLTHYLTSLAIEGEEGYDPSIAPVAAETVRDYLTWGIDANGLIYETNGKNGAGLLFALSSADALARRGQNFFGHPHLRKMTAAQVADVVPQGGINVNNGTWGCAPFWGDIASLLKAFYPDDKAADWLIRQDRPEQADFDPAAYRKQLATTGPDRDHPASKFELLGATDVLTTLDWQGFHNKDGTLKPAWEREDLHLPLVFNDPIHGLLAARTSNDEDALYLMFEARPDLHTIGHQHHDSGQFYLAALGKMWAVEAGPKAAYSPDHNTVLIDGKGHSDVGAAPMVRYLDTVQKDPVTLAAADLKNAYDFGWCCPQHFSWFEPDFPNWKISPETDPDVVAYFKGTQHYKMRLWGDNILKQNWGPTMRIEGNPVQYAFRSAGIVNGKHPYALVLDDIAKDGNTHQYDWLMQVPPGIRMIPANIGKDNAPVAAILTRLPAPPDWNRMEPTETLPKGEPGLLVCVLDKNDTKNDLMLAKGITNTVGSNNYPLRVEQLASPEATGGSPLKTRVVITKQAIDPQFRVLLIPVQGGDPMPTVSYDSDTGTATIIWPGQKDVLHFQTAPDHRTHLDFQRS